MASYGHHLYTISNGERDRALNQLCFLDEGVACYVFDAPQTVQTMASVQTRELYRLFNPGNGDHFYTADATERDNAANNGYQLEGVAGYLFDSQVSGTVPLYRLLNLGNGDHFYTADATESDNAANNGYQLEGVAGYLFDSPQVIQTSVNTPTTTELYRLLNPTTDDHLYTISGVERNNAITQAGYRYEGVACFVFADQRAGSVPFYRSYNPVVHDHFLTTSVQERVGAIASGWQQEGVACYVLPQALPGSVPLHRMYTPGETRIKSFSANPSYIKPNEKATLRWDVLVFFPTYTIRLHVRACNHNHSGSQSR
jgi:Repeat of unknown function (DUF5648)